MRLSAPGSLCSLSAPPLTALIHVYFYCLTRSLDRAPIDTTQLLLTRQVTCSAAQAVDADEQVGCRLTGIRGGCCCCLTHICMQLASAGILILVRLSLTRSNRGAGPPSSGCCLSFSVRIRPR